MLTTAPAYAIILTERGKESKTMTNWYMNPELHDEDYEELLELLAEEEEEG